MYDAVPENGSHLSFIKLCNNLKRHEICKLNIGQVGLKCIYFSRVIREGHFNTGDKNF
jgi:hypothetical protein